MQRLIDFSQVMKDLDGKAIRDGEAELTLRSVTVNALMTLLPDERSLGGEEKARRYTLGMKIHKAKEPLELKAEQVTLVKKCVGGVYTPLVVGQAFHLLDNDTGEGAP